MWTRSLKVERTRKSGATIVWAFHCKRFPAEMPCCIQIALKDGRALNIEKQNYEGFYTRPLSWKKAVARFERLAAPYTDTTRRVSIVEIVAHLETKEVEQLTELFSAPFVHTR